MTPAGQIAWYYVNGRLLSTELPAEYSYVTDGVQWGCCEDLFTPAFWRLQADIGAQHGRYSTHRLGRDLIEEAAACLLGGYGIPAELGLAAFRRLRDMGLLSGYPTGTELENALSEPFHFGEGTRRYRFARQKAYYLAGMLARLADMKAPEDDLDLRNELLCLGGVGPKTASWIVRNHRNSSRVAILDVHILRAGRIMGLFSSKDDPGKNYFQMEGRFLSFCDALGAPAGILDALMWDYMRRVGPTAARSSPRHRSFASSPELVFS